MTTHDSTTKSTNQYGHNHADITQLLKAFSGQARILTIPRAYIDMLNGNHLTALLLSQAVFLSDRAADDDGWFAMSYADWTEMLAMSEYQVRQGAKALASFGLETALRRSAEHEMAATLHYRVNMDALTARILEVLRTRSEETSERRSEETSERSYMYEIKEREGAPTTEEPTPDYLTSYQRELASKNDTAASMNGWQLVDAYAKAIGMRADTVWGVYRNKKAAATLASEGVTPAEVTAIVEEKLASGHPSYRFDFLISDVGFYRASKQRKPQATEPAFIDVATEVDDDGVLLTYGIRADGSRELVGRG